MFGKIGAVSSKMLYIGFNSENEKAYTTESGDGYKVLDGYGTESMSNFAVTRCGSFVGGYFMDICTKDVPFPATGFFLKASGKMLFNGVELKENQRKRITEADEVVICGEDYNCLFYPIIEDNNEYYLEYSKEDNKVGIIGTFNGVVKAEGRIITKFGFAFSTDTDFVKENAEVEYFPVCSVNRLIGYGG